MDAPDFIPDQQASQQAPAEAPDFIPDEAPDFIPDSHAQDTSKYETPGQQVLTGVEGLARGATAGLSDALAVGMRKGASALGVPDEDLHYVAPNPEDIAGRKEANPIESTGSELAGNIGFMTKLPQIGSKAINGMIQMGLISGGDELSKAMLGQGDPVDAVASHMAESAGIGLLTGGLFGKVEELGGRSLKALEDSKIGNRVGSFLAGIGHATSFPETSKVVSLENSALTQQEIKNLHNGAFQAGQKFYNAMSGLVKHGTTATSGVIGYNIGGPLGGVLSSTIEKTLEKILGPTVQKASQKAIMSTILKAGASGTVDNISQLLDHATTCSAGAQKISRGIEALFNSTSNEALNYEASEKQREKLRKYIENDELGQEVQDESNKTQAPAGFATGGKVAIEKPNAVATAYPEQNVLLSATKGRVAGYLNSIRPVKNAMKLPFDTEHKDPQKEREYNKALDFANKPMSVLKKIKNGTLLPKDMEHLTNMYPELHSHLSKKIMEKIADHKMDETKKPPYHVRQALSLFMGSNLDTSLSQPSMQAAQNVFAQQNAQKQAQTGSKNSLSKLGQNSMTDDQARERRLNKN